MHKAKISVPVTTPYPKTLKDAKKAAENKADLIELRLDLIKPTATQLKTLIKTIQIPIIATSRTKKEGGKTTPKQAKQQLTNAIEAKPAFIDIELSLNTKMRKKLTKKAKAKKIKIISSTHYTKTTPKLSTLKKTLQKQLKENADAYKIVTYAKKETDNQTLTKLAEHANNKKLKIITFAMGKKGKQSRINSINNSYITFAALEKGKESAPGQITLKKALELKQGYSNYARKNTKTITLLGYPVTHSKSPQMQNAAFKKLNLNYKYISIPTPPSKFKEKLKKLEQNPNVKGANITTPHKLQALNQCKHNDKSATQTLAANTLVKENNHFKTFNTDAKGFTQALKEKNVKITRKKTVVLGAGGAARAILFALTQKKPSQTTIINRTHQKAQALAKQFPKTQATPWTQENLEKTIANADLLINTTTIGMHPNNQSPIPKQILHKKLTVFDAVYNPKQTKLLKDAKAKGCKTISGHAMLLYQGTAAFELWTKTKAPVETMRKTLQKTLKQKTTTQPKNNIILTGFMGTGKSLVGKQLAQTLGKQFTDIDKIIEKQAGKTISQIFTQKGENHFRKLEKQAVKKASKQKNTVISTGGGAILDNENTAHLRETGVIIQLESTPQEILNNLKNTGNRPLLNTEKKLEKIKKMLSWRQPYYQQADLTIKTNKQKPQKIAQQISKLF